MSINKLRNFMGRGLDKAIFVAIAVVMGISMIAYFGKPTGGPGGMSPKYFRIFSFAVAASISPASTTTALVGP